MTGRALAAALFVAAAAPGTAQDASAPPSRPAGASLRVEWRAARAPGITWAEFAHRASADAPAVRIVAVRIDPARARFALVQRTAAGGHAPGWTIGDAPDDAIVALNAGQFTGISPWGWVVRDGVERLAPGRGPLSSAFVVRRDGSLAWVDGDALGTWRAREGIETAFQSYPALLHAGASTPAGFDAVSQTQRDARLALGVDAAGHLLIALTRYDGLGGALDFAPLGLTTPEMAALMRALGARQAMLLDGGISAQLLVRTPEGEERWSGLRRVPLALIVRARN